MEHINNSIAALIGQNTILENEQHRCPYCGKEYEKKVIPIRFANTEKICYSPICTCKEDREEADRIRKLEEKRKIDKAIQLANRFNNSMMSKRFQKMRFDLLDSTKNVAEIEFCKEYANNFDIETSKGIQMIGNVGTGKTTLLACICNELMIKGYNCLFTTLTNLLGEFTSYSSEHSGNIRGKIEWLLKFDFIVFDDIGRETTTDRRKEILFTIIDSLYNNESIVAFSANPEMLSTFTSNTEFTALLDRLRAMCPKRFEFRGQSLR